MALIGKSGVGKTNSLKGINYAGSLAFSGMIDDVKGPDVIKQFSTKFYFTQNGKDRRLFKIGCIGRLMGPEGIKKEVAYLLTKSDPSDTVSSKTRTYKILVIFFCAVLVAAVTI